MGVAPLGKRRPAVEATGEGEQVPELKKEACRGGCVALHYQPSQIPDPSLAKPDPSAAREGLVASL